MDDKERKESKRKILNFLRKCPNGSSTTWEIAQKVFPEKWSKPYSRSNLVQFVERLGIEAGCIRLAPKDRWGCGRLCITKKQREEFALLN